MKNFTILISSAERNVRRAIRRAVESCRYPTIVEETAESARAVGRSVEQSFDVILIDIDEPSGMENLEAILHRRTGATILVVASFSRLEDALQAVRLGASDVLEKPATPEEIATAIETAIAQRANILRSILRSARRIGTHAREPRSISDGDLNATDPPAVRPPENSDAATTGCSYLECMIRATTAVKRSDESGARRWLRAGLSIDTERPEAYNLLGVVSEMRQDLVQAMRYYRAAVALDPMFEPARNNLHRMSGLKDGGKRDLGVAPGVEHAKRE